MTENFAERLKHLKLTIKDHIAPFFKKTYFYEKLININKNVTSAEKKRNYNITSNRKLINVLTRVKLN